MRCIRHLAVAYVLAWIILDLDYSTSTFLNPHAVVSRSRGAEAVLVKADSHALTTPSRERRPDAGQLAGKVHSDEDDQLQNLLERFTKLSLSQSVRTKPVTAEKMSITRKAETPPSEARRIKAYESEHIRDAAIRQLQELIASFNAGLYASSDAFAVSYQEQVLQRLGTMLHLTNKAEPIVVQLGDFLFQSLRLETPQNVNKAITVSPERWSAMIESIRTYVTNLKPFKDHELRQTLLETLQRVGADGELAIWLSKVFYADSEKSSIECQARVIQTIGLMRSTTQTGSAGNNSNSQVVARLLKLLGLTENIYSPYRDQLFSAILASLTVEERRELQPPTALATP